MSYMRARDEARLAASDSSPPRLAVSGAASNVGTPATATSAPRAMVTRDPRRATQKSPIVHNIHTEQVGGTAGRRPRGRTQKWKADRKDAAVKKSRSRVPTAGEKTKHHPRLSNDIPEVHAHTSDFAPSDARNTGDGDAAAARMEAEWQTAAWARRAREVIDSGDETE